MLAARSTSRGSRIELLAQGTAQSDDTSLRAGGCSHIDLLLHNINGCLNFFLQLI